MKESTRTKYNERTFNYEINHSENAERTSPSQTTFRRTPSPSKN